MICGAGCCTRKQWGPLFCDLVPYFLRKLVPHCLSGEGSKSAFHLPPVARLLLHREREMGWWTGGEDGGMGVEWRGGGVGVLGGGVFSR